MAKIIKVGSQNLTPNKIANPFKTSRNSSTNPFKYNNFEGNTLPFELAADVFSGTKQEHSSKLRMIASSVTGSMSKMRSSIEPIVNFAKRVYGGLTGGISAAWNLTFRTPISEIPGIARIPGVRQLDEFMSQEVKTPSLSGVSEKLSDSLGYFNKDLKDVGRDVLSAGKEGIHVLGEGFTSCWESIVAKIPSRTRYSANTPVVELEAALKEELALGGAA